MYFTSYVGVKTTSCNAHLGLLSEMILLKVSLLLGNIHVLHFTVQSYYMSYSYWQLCHHLWQYWRNGYGENYSGTPLKGHLWNEDTSL